MLDRQNRVKPRFPAEIEEDVRKSITSHLHALKKEYAEIRGIAGAASGGDILFHEICISLDIPSEIYLALPVDQFMDSSVSFAGVKWENRYLNLVEKLPVYVLKGTQIGDNVWKESNLWMLKTALKNGADRMTLLALWNGGSGDGIGGTEHMLQLAFKEQIEILIIDMQNN
jgi:hypothetical protein